MFKIPFHSCCNNNGGGEVVFPPKINPFFYFYDKKTLGIRKSGKKILIFQNKVFKFKSREFKEINSIDVEVDKTLIKKGVGYFCHPDPEIRRFETFECCCFCGSCSCTAHIIENDKGEVQLKYDYSNNSSFEHFWNVEFKSNKNKYVLLKGFINTNIMALMQDNFIKNVRFYSWDFGVMPLFRLLENLNLNLSFLLRTDSEINFVLITSNFILEEGTFNFKVSKNVIISFIFNLIYVKERDLELYNILKAIDQNANYVFIFSNYKNTNVSINLNYLTFSQGTKTIQLYKNKSLKTVVL